MKSNAGGKHEPVEPDQLVRMVELELQQKRAAREQAIARYGSFRTASFVFIFAVLVGASLAFFFVFSSGRMDGLHARKSAPAISTATISPAPR